MCALVTGVQTCALPILARDWSGARRDRRLDKPSWVGGGIWHDPSTDAGETPRIGFAFHGGGQGGGLGGCFGFRHPGRGAERMSVVSGKSVAIRVDLGCRRMIKKK